MRKNRYASAALLVFLFMMVGIGICSVWKIPMKNLEFERPSCEEADQVIDFYMEDEEGKTSSVSLKLHARHYTEDEIKVRFQQCYEANVRHILGENPDSRHISKKLNLTPAAGFDELTVMIYPAEASYFSATGDLCWEEIEDAVCETELYMDISYDTCSENYRLPVTLLKNENVSCQDVQHYLEKMESEELQASDFILPESLNGKQYRYYRKADTSTILGLGIFLIAILALLWYRDVIQVKEEQKHRLEQMEYDYPELLSKFLIYLKAGLSVRKTWQKIVEDYGKRVRKKGKRWLYEEMDNTLQEMEMGLGERKAYLKFGKRCGLQSLIRFGSLLEQNLRKGTDGIMGVLEAERIQALEHRKQEIRTAGEIAGMKLMLPMMVLFGLVMVMIMVPSFMSFGI